MSIFSIIGSILGPAKEIIDEIITSDEERLQAQTKLLQVESALTAKLIEYDTALTQARRDVLVAEASGDSWLQRSWRPLTMLSFVSVVLSNYVIVPYAAAFGKVVPTLVIPGGMWALLTTGLGGYVVGRSVEKVFKLKNGN